MTDVTPTVVDPDRLRLARLKRRLRQRDIAGRVGAAPQRVSDFEQGLRHPSPGQVVILAQILGPEIFAENLAVKKIRRAEIGEFARERTAPARRDAR